MKGRPVAGCGPSRGLSKSVDPCHEQGQGDGVAKEGGGKGDHAKLSTLPANESDFANGDRQHQADKGDEVGEGLRHWLIPPLEEGAPLQPSAPAR